MKRLYFAYASNMHEIQMNKRCPESTFLDVVKLDGWSFTFSPTHRGANMYPNDDYVFGCLYEITQACENQLDYYEGVQNGHYQKREIELANWGKQSALVYIIDNCSGLDKPYKDYHNRIVEALTQRGVEQSYIDKIINMEHMGIDHPTRNYRHDSDGLGG